MESKYDQIRCIQVERLDLASDSDAIDDDPQSDSWSFGLELEEVMDSLPGAFVKRWKHGLGITKRYRSIISVVEHIGDVRELHLSVTADTIELRRNTLIMPMTTFDNLCAEIRRIDDRASNVATRFKTSAVYNSVAEAFGLPQKPPSRGRHPMVRLLSEEVSGVPKLTENEQQQLLLATMAQTRTLAREKPQALAALRLDVDIANLDELIDQFSKALEKGQPEGYWQRFFQRNPFALHLAFGFPLIQVQGQASVGGTTLSGGEGRFADFLARNAITGNIAIFEIKKPASLVISRSPYRRTVYPPATELTGAVGQVLDQKVELIKSLAQIKESSKIYDIHAFAIRCCVVIGRTPEDDARRKALEAFRGNSSTVDVITYDELLEKLKQLRELLAGASS